MRKLYFLFPIFFTLSVYPAVYEPEGKIVLLDEYIVIYSEVENYVGLTFRYEHEGGLGFLWVDLHIESQSFARIKCPFDIAYVTLSSAYPVTWRIVSSDRERRSLDVYRQLDRRR
jgi:hypothetical protein